jgi:hypothetical protein
MKRQRVVWLQRHGPDGQWSFDGAAYRSRSGPGERRGHGVRTHAVRRR